MSPIRTHVGNVELTVIVDARERIPRRDLYPTVPVEAWVPFTKRWPTYFDGPDGLAWQYACYVLHSGGRTTLVDAGVGPAGSPSCTAASLAGSLLATLEAQGLRASDIDQVILTHLHPDHVGWCVSDYAATPRITFPNARYIAHVRDWETFWTPQGQATIPFPFVDQCLGLIRDEHRIDLVDGSIAKLDDMISLVHLPGHTPGSIVVSVATGAEPILLVGDVIANPAQLTEPAWRYVWDTDSGAAQASRLRLASLLSDGGWLGAAHCGLGRIDFAAGQIRWEPA